MNIGNATAYQLYNLWLLYLPQTQFSSIKQYSDENYKTVFIYKTSFLFISNLFGSWLAFLNTLQSRAHFSVVTSGKLYFFCQVNSDPENRKTLLQYLRHSTNSHLLRQCRTADCSAMCPGPLCAVTQWNSARLQPSFIKFQGKMS